MELLDELVGRNASRKQPFLIAPDTQLTFDDLLSNQAVGLSQVHAGDVVALVGDFDARSLSTLLRLIDLGVIVVPLTQATAPEHEYYFEAAEVDIVIDGCGLRRRKRKSAANPLLGQLRQAGHPGLVLFSSGTTGRPKAILHDFTKFLARYRTPRPTLRTLNFLLFDHIGGVNTLFHTLFNGGLVVAPSGRTTQAIAADIGRHRIELLPTTPTFLRLMLMEGVLEAAEFSSLKVVTYGTERMDQSTLERVCRALPEVDFRQTYGMSELGILRVKSRARDSLWMLVGGEGVETRIVDGVLQIRSLSRMLGYLNAPSPFDAEWWYDTGDIVERDGAYIKVIGRSKEIINVGGVKVLPAEVERVAMLHPDVLRAKARGVANPITGQHIEVTCEAAAGKQLNRQVLRVHFQQHLAESVRPHIIRIGEVAVNHRYKQQ
jgi:long-chain acyl-CoA synthetase